MADTKPIAQQDHRPEAAPPRLLNMRQVAAYMGCSFWTARDYILQGLIPVDRHAPSQGATG